MNEQSTPLDLEIVVATLDRIENRLNRERGARQQAERLLEEKSLAVYYANEDLRKLTASLEDQVKERTLALEEALASAQIATRHKSEFLANMSHEIRTPLNAILGMAQLLMDSRLDAQQQQWTKTLLSSGELLLSVISDILDISKIESGKLELEQHFFSLRALLDEVQALYLPSARAKQLPLHCTIDDDIQDAVVGDSARLKQVLGNLLSNAIKFTAQGQVRLHIACVKSSATSERHIRFEVIDTGIGIPKAARHRLFKVFSQVNRSTTREYGGTGLGLAICERLTLAMGGQIGVRDLGQGTCFWVELPFASPQNNLPTPTTAITTSIKQQMEACQQLRILVAEDDRANQLLMRGLLTAHVATLDIVANGDLAVQAVQSNPYDLIIMDAQMPVMDGLAATRAIRALGESIKQPTIVALTASAFEQDFKDCIEAGMNDCLRKPISKMVLFAYLSKVKLLCE
jgi:signal transduction histidine kinase/ActR/RegA family two-component response regulator